MLIGTLRDKIRRLILFDLPRYKSCFVLKLDRSLDDAGMYVDHTGTSVKTLLVTNYAELEEVIGKVRRYPNPVSSPQNLKGSKEQ
jgi:hypothetical protein